MLRDFRHNWFFYLEYLAEMLLSLERIWCGLIQMRKKTMAQSENHLAGLLATAFAAGLK